VLRGLLRQRRDVQASERDVDAFRAIRVGERIRPPGARDVHLDDDEVPSVGVVAGCRAVDVLVDDQGPVVRSKIGREGREAERREQRILDGPPVRARGLRQGGEDELDAQRSHGRHGQLLP
jgi:hypothetical protein